MIYGYARVSTNGQAKKGNSLTDQEEKLREAGATLIYKDSCTGTKLSRPAFDELLTLLQDGDTLVVTKLDRFARTAPDGATLVRDLVDKGVKVHILNMGVADNTPMGKLMVTILLAFAEFERDLIVERTSAGKAVKRETDPNYREGRRSKVIDGFALVYEQVEQGDLSVAEACRQLGISKGTWYNRLKEVG